MPSPTAPLNARQWGALGGQGARAGWGPGSRRAQRPRSHALSRAAVTPAPSQRARSGQRPPASSGLVVEEGGKCPGWERASKKSSTRFQGGRRRCPCWDGEVAGGQHRSATAGASCPQPCPLGLGSACAAPRSLLLPGLVVGGAWGGMGARMGWGAWEYVGKEAAV